MKNLHPLSFAIITALYSSNGFAEKSKQSELIEEELVVFGYRQSLQNAIEEKRNSSSIVESVFATDIGKLPDSSIAETIARLPGVAAQRLDGRASSITIRGLGEDYNPATLNGREQVSLDDNRGVEFDVYPSEIVEQVTIYKTPQANLINQGIGGTIELSTVKPLSKDEMTFSINLRGEKNSIGALNPDGEDQGFRASAAYIDQFANDTVGIALSFAHMESPNNEERWSAWQWPEITTGDGEQAAIIAGAKPFVRSSLLTRDTLMGVLELKPSDSLSFSLDFLTIDFEDEKILRGIEIPAYFNTFGNDNDGFSNITVNNGVVTSGVLNNAQVVLRNDYETREAQLDSIGARFSFSPNDVWTYTVDVSRSEVERTALSLETYSGTGRGTDNGATQDLLFSLNSNQEGARFVPGTFDASSETFTPSNNFYAGLDQIELGVPLNWGGDHPFVYQNRAGGPRCFDQYADGNCYRWTGFDGFVNTPVVNDEITTFKLSTIATFEEGLFSHLEIGLNINDRSKSKEDTGFYLTLPGYITNLDQVQTLLDNGNYNAALDSAEFDNNYTLPVPQEFQIGTASLEFLGMGNMIAYDTLGLYNSGLYWTGLEEVASAGQPSRAPNTWTVDEEVITAFAQLNIDSYVGNLPVKGNLGLQLISTDQTSTGFSAQLNDDGTVDVETVSGGSTYEDILPSANLSVELDDGELLRFGYSRTLSRARMDRLKASYGYGDNRSASTYTGVSGNPELRPYLANQLDLSYEWYFKDEGYASIGLFYKQLDQWQIQVRNQELSSDAFNSLVTAGQNPQSVDITQWQTTSGGSIQGAEFTANIPGKKLIAALDGFGLVLSGSFISSEIDVDGSKQVVPGLSDEIQNATLYYENAGFEFRTSLRKRSDFTGDIFGLSFAKNPALVKGSSIWDAQVSYDFSEIGLDGLEVSIQAQNLSDEAFVTVTNDDRELVLDYQRFGRNYLFGVSYKF